MAAFLVDGLSDPVREMRSFGRRVTGGGPADGIDVPAPAGAHHARQGVVEARGQGVALLVGAAGVVGRVVTPPGNQAAALADDHAIGHHRGVIDQVAKARHRGPVAFQGRRPV